MGHHKFLNVEAPRLLRWALACAVCHAGLMSSAAALEFRTAQVNGVGQVLLAQDCDEQDPKNRCRPNETQVSEGDADRLNQLLSSKRYDEVWLNSGGGNSDEGQRIGRVLRNHRMAVRIPKGSECASACTVAFLGGVIRTVDVGGHFLVHARLGLLNGVQKDLMARVLANPEQGLRREFLLQMAQNRSFVAERMMYIQTMLRGEPDAQSYTALVGQTAEDHPYLESGTFAKHVARIKVEGAAVAHAILMENEKASFDAALASFQPYLGQLGRRADKAHQLMTTMFATTIVRVADMPQETMFKLGVVTPALPP